MKKIERLKTILKKMGSVLVAYSGGVDSTFLLKIAHDVLGERVLAVTAASPLYPKEEVRFASRMAHVLGVRHKVIKTNELKKSRFAANSPRRCYFCKTELFSRLKAIAAKYKLGVVVDASNFDDKRDFRPGSKAAALLGVRSPLVEARFTKKQIRRASKKLGLSTWDKPSLACLASRIPYGEKISPFVLARIHRAETLLRKMGVRQVRVRHYNTQCRIEVLPHDMPLLMRKRSAVTQRLRALGYTYATLDLEGYRTGSMNRQLLRRK